MGWAPASERGVDRFVEILLESFVEVLFEVDLFATEHVARRHHPGVGGHHHPDVRAQTAGLHQHGHQVVGVLAEKRVRIDDVVKLTPFPPFPGERPQGEGLARADVAVPEDELASVSRAEALHDRL